MEGWLDSSRHAVSDDPSSSLDFTMGQVCNIVVEMGCSSVLKHRWLVSLHAKHLSLSLCTWVRIYGLKLGIAWYCGMQ